MEASAKQVDYLKRLTAELPGILAWAVQGCLDWQRQGLGLAAAVSAAAASLSAYALTGATRIMHSSAIIRAARNIAAFLFLVMVISDFLLNISQVSQAFAGFSFLGSGAFSSP